MVSNGGGDTQVNFGARARLTPHFQFSAKSFRSLAHTPQAPMTYPFPLIRHIGIHAFSVVSDSQPKQIGAVRDLSFDSAGLGMAKSISQRLTRDPEDFNVDIWI